MATTPVIEETKRPTIRFFPLVEGAGFIAILLLACLTPLFFVPIPLFPTYLIEGAEIILAKWVFIQGAAMVVCCIGGLALLGPGWRRYLGPAFWPAFFLALFLGWSALSIAVNPVPGWSLNEWLPRLALGICALLGVLFLADWRRARLMIAGLLLTGFLVSLVGVLGGLGVREINRFVYGQDPRDTIEIYQERNIVRQVQGGMVSSGSASTLGNPEYAGTFSAAMAVLAAVVLFDWVPRSRRRLLLRIALSGLIGLLLLHLALTSSRQAWVALFLCFLLRLFLILEVPRRWLAAGFCVLLALTVVFGILISGVAALFMLAGVAAWSFSSGRAMELFRSADRFNMGLIVGVVMLMAGGLVAFSIPGPWNPSGVRILQRFSSLTDRRDDSLRERMVMYAIASDVAWRNPLFGAGPGRYGVEYLPTLARLSMEDESGAMMHARQRTVGYLAAQAHNDYLQIAAETGVPGIIFFLSMLLFLFARLDIVRREGGWRGHVALALMMFLAAYCSIMFTSFPLNMPSRAAVFWSLVGTSLGLIASPRDHEDRANDSAPEAAA